MKKAFVMVTLSLFMQPLMGLAQVDRPNIVLVFMDNFGWGELGVYGGGILRGAATPRIDSLAEEGLRLLNFNVEAQCTPSRAAMLTGRYAIRTGNAEVPLGVGEYGLTQWEYTHCPRCCRTRGTPRGCSGSGILVTLRADIPPTRASMNGSVSPTRRMRATGQIMICSDPESIR